MKIRHLISAWWPTALVVAIILYATLSSDPVGDIDMPLIPHLDKLIHAIMFGGLFSAIAFDSYRDGYCMTRYRLLMYAAIAVAAGGATELLQYAEDNVRSADWLDFAADAGGVVIAFFTAPPAIRAVIK